MRQACIHAIWITGILFAGGCSKRAIPTGPLTAAVVVEAGHDPIFVGLPSHPVAVSFRVRNEGAAASPPLKLILGCACQLQGPPLPERLSPGQEATITLKLRAPSAGRMQYQLPLVSTEAGERLAMLEAMIEARLTAPSWYLGPRDMLMNGLEHETASHEFVWESIEEQGSEPWVTGMTVVKGTAVSLSLTSEVEPLGVDGHFIKRRYRMPVTLDMLPEGRHSATISVSYSRHPDPITSIRLNAQVLPICSVYPREVTLSADSPDRLTAEVAVIDRSEPNGRSPLAVEYDANALRVESPDESTGPANRYRISLKRAAVSFEQTDVRFLRDGTVLCSVAVRPTPGPSSRNSSP